MKRIYNSYDDIDIPKDDNENYIVDDPDMFDSVYITRIFDRYHPDKVKFIREKRVFTNLMVYTFKCKSCGKTQTRSFRTANIENHKTLLCQDCLNIERYGYAHTYENKEKQRYALDRVLEKHGGFGMANKKIRDKIESTNLEKFGSKCSLKDPEVNAKARKTTKEKYGVEYALQSKKIYDETVETLKKRYGVEHALQNDKIKDKMREKIIEKYGVSNVMQIPEVQEKSTQNRKQNNLEKYGKSNWMEYGTPEFKEYMMDKYGRLSFISTYEVREKIKSTCLNKYGRSSYLGSDQWKNDIINKYGTLHPSFYYNYYGIYFDSSWELAVWIYCIDNNIPIIRNTNMFEYKDMYNNVRHYIPDFIINGNYVEVKGPQFWNNGKMIFPYNKLHHNSKEFTLEEKEYMDDLYERKHRCGLSNGVLFWKEDDCKKYIDYCNNKYPNWNILFRKDNPMNPSYWCFGIINPGHPQSLYYAPRYYNTGITPYDINKNDKYVDMKGEGITPYDI